MLCIEAILLFLFFFFFFSSRRRHTRCLSDWSSDVCSSDLDHIAQLPNVLLTPHIGASTVETQQQIGVRVVEIIEAFVQQSITEVHDEAEITFATSVDGMVRV